GREAGLCYRMILAEWHEHANSSHAIGPLCPRRNRPRCHAAEQSDEIAATDHSMTSSASASNFAGNSTPIALAALRLTTSRNLVGRCTGRSLGFAPFKICPV